MQNKDGVLNQYSVVTYDIPMDVSFEWFISIIRMFDGGEKKRIYFKKRKSVQNTNNFDDFLLTVVHLAYSIEIMFICDEMCHCTTMSFFLKKRKRFFVQKKIVKDCSEEYRWRNSRDITRCVHNNRHSHANRSFCKYFIFSLWCTKEPFLHLLPLLFSFPFSSFWIFQSICEWMSSTSHSAIHHFVSLIHSSVGTKTPILNQKGEGRKERKYFTRRWMWKCKVWEKENKGISMKAQRIWKCEHIGTSFSYFFILTRILIF